MLKTEQRQQNILFYYQKKLDKSYWLPYLINSNANVKQKLKIHSLVKTVLIKK